MGWWRNVNRGPILEAGDQDDREHGQAHGNFVRNHLRTGAKRADQRIVRVRGPPGDDDAEHAQRRNAEHKEDADIHVGDGVRGAEGNDDEDGECREHNHEGRDPEDESVSLGGDDVFFEQQFDGVGDGLQQAVRAYTHGAEAHLHVCENFSLEPVHGDDGDGKSDEDEHDIDDRPENVAGAAGRFVAIEIARDVLDQVVHFVIVLVLSG